VIHGEFLRLLLQHRLGLIEATGRHDLGDLELLRERIEFHGIAGIVADGRVLPVPLEAQLHSAPRITAMRNLAARAQLLPIAEALNQAAIPFLVLKGLALVHGLYPDTGMRSAGDIDLLVRRADAMRAHDLLLALGYRAEKTPRGIPMGDEAVSDDYECTYTHPQLVEVDLHWEIAHPMLGFRASFDAMYEDHVTLLDGLLPAPSLANHLWYLCVHGSRHLWCRWIWLYDVAVALQQMTEADHRKLEEAIRTRGNAAFIRDGLSLVRHMLMRGPRRKTLLGEFAETFLLRTHKRPSNNFDYAICHLRMVDSWRARFVCLRQLLTGILEARALVFRPTPDERRRIPIPRPLDFLWYALRPCLLLGRALRKLIGSV
jgi:hypothetical protein